MARLAADTRLSSTSKALHYLIKDKSVYLIALWPYPETNPGTIAVWEFNYRALFSTYKLNLQIVSEPDLTMDLHTIPSVAIEQKTKNTIPIQDFVHPEKAVYYVGNSKYSHPSHWAKTDFSVHIEAPSMYEHPLYGHQAAAIVLHDRYLKNANL